MGHYRNTTVGKEHDRRRKLTDEQREQIKELYASGKYSMMQLAIKFGVHRDTINRIVKPEFDAIKRKHNKKYYEAHPIPAEKRKEYLESHYKYKQKLYEEGKIS